MAYPLVIFGAGASFDYLVSDVSESKVFKNDNPFQPPLLKDLFDQDKFGDIQLKYNHLSALASIMIPKLRKGIDFEDYLSSLDEFGEENLDRKRQILDLRFYLQEVFSNASLKYVKPVNNYKSFIGILRDNLLPSSKVVYVTYNYDSLLERCFPLFKQLNDYVSGSEKIIKMHGSHNWVYVISNQMARMFNETTDRNWLLEHIGNVEEIENNRLMMIEDKDYYSIVHKSIPAIAVPMRNKNKHLCHESHIDILDTELEEIDRVIIIGWKGADEYLLEKIKKIGKKLPTLVVTGGTENPSILKNKFLKYNLIVDMQYGIHRKGFNDFMGTKKLEDFLTT